MISSGTAFFLVFTALYLLESVILCGGSAVIFYRRLSGALKYRFAKNLPEFGKVEAVHGSTLSAAASLFVTGSLPLFFSHKGFILCKREQSR